MNQCTNVFLRRRKRVVQRTSFMLYLCINFTVECKKNLHTHLGSASSIILQMGRHHFLDRPIHLLLKDECVGNILSALRFFDETHRVWANSANNKNPHNHHFPQKKLSRISYMTRVDGIAQFSENSRWRDTIVRSFCSFLPFFHLLYFSSIPIQIYISPDKLFQQLSVLIDFSTLIFSL